MIRPARPEDAAALAALHLRALHRAYADFIDPEELGTLEERVVRWDELLARPERATLVHDLSGQLAGFAAVAPADADLGPAVGALAALYVDPPAQGAGVGGLLHDAALEALRAEGFTGAALWVFAANGHARHMYEARGWVLDDPAAIAAAHGAHWWAPAVRYRRAL